MHDRRFGVSSANALAAVLMLIGIGLVIVNYLFGSSTNDHIGFLGMPFVAGGVAARVRALLCRMHDTLHDAFNAGREIGRMEGEGSSVRSLR